MSEAFFPARELQGTAYIRVGLLQEKEPTHTLHCRVEQHDSRFQSIIFLHGIANEWINGTIHPALSQI